MNPLTENERKALLLAKQKGALTVGQTLIIHAAAPGNFSRPDIFSPVARGLERRGLALLTRPNRRGPLVMTLTEKGQSYAT